MGEAFSLIEKDHREEKITLKYNDEKFSVPSNIFFCITFLCVPKLSKFSRSAFAKLACTLFMHNVQDNRASKSNKEKTYRAYKKDKNYIVNGSNGTLVIL